MNLGYSISLLLLGLIGFLVWVSYEIYFIGKAQLKENRARKKQLRDLQKLTGPEKLAACITHEIGNPLSVIKDGVNGLLRKTDDEIVKQDLAQILIKLESISKIVQNSRDYLYRTDGLKEDHINLKDVIDDVLLFYSQRLESHGVDLYLKNIEDMFFKGHRGQFEQLLLDLLSTSMEAIEELPEKWIEITANQTSDHVRVSFRNSGHGFSKEFGRRFMISKYSGDIHFENEPHTKFILNLPLANDHHP